MGKCRTLGLLLPPTTRVERCIHLPLLPWCPVYYMIKTCTDVNHRVVHHDYVSTWGVSGTPIRWHELAEVPITDTCICLPRHCGYITRFQTLSNIQSNVVLLTSFTCQAKLSCLGLINWSNLLIHAAISIMVNLLSILLQVISYPSIPLASISYQSRNNLQSVPPYVRTFTMAIFDHFCAARVKIGFGWSNLKGNSKGNSKGKHYFDTPCQFLDAPIEDLSVPNLKHLCPLIICHNGWIKREHKHLVDLVGLLHYLHWLSTP
jgi:hypothetical protein